MKRLDVSLSIAILLALAACAQAPVRPSTPPTAAINAAAGANARLPASDEPYLDAAWFSQPLTAERAVQAALLNNPTVRAELVRLEAAESERHQAGLISNPMLSVMALRPNNGGRWELDYGLMQSLYDMLARSRRVALADATRQRTEAEVLAALLTIIQDTEAAYYRAVAAKIRLRLQQGHLQLERQALALAERQSRLGLGSGGDLLEQRANVAMREHQLRQSDEQAISARAELAGRIGGATAAMLTLPDRISIPDIEGLDDARAQQLAARHRPELAASTAAVAEASAERQLQSGLLRNTEPSLGPAGVREADGMALNGVELRLALPVFDTGKTRAALADAKWREAGFLDQAQRRRVPLEVETALLTMATLRGVLGSVRDHHEQQVLLTTLAQRNHRNGTGTYAAQLLAEHALLDSDERVLDAEAELVASIVALQRATGLAVAAIISR